MRSTLYEALHTSAAPSPAVSLDAVMPLVYDELHRLAAAYMRRERNGHTLQPTALVNETYMRLLGQHSVDFSNRAQLLGVAAQMMRRILANYAERHSAGKRGGALACVCLEDVPEPAAAPGLAFTAVDEALNRLALLDPRQAKVVELRLFGGMTVEETAEFLRVSPATVNRDWASGRLWLTHELKPSGLH